MTNELFSGMPRRVNPNYSNWSEKEKESIPTEEPLQTQVQYEYEYSGGYQMSYNYNTTNGNSNTQTEFDDQPIFNPQVMVLDDDDQQNKLVIKNRPLPFMPSRPQNSNEMYNSPTASNIGSIVCGLISLFTCLIPIVPLVTGGLGLFFSIDGMKKSKHSGMYTPAAAIAGLICSALGMGINLFFYGGIFFTALFG